jgi:acetoin utilization protein AcuB
MTVARWMTRDPYILKPQDTIIDALLVMRAGGFRHLPVTEDGVLVGIITDRDVRSAWPSDVPNLADKELNNLVPKIHVRELMHQPVIAVHQHDHLEDAVRLVLKHNIGGLPVLDGWDQLVGMLTTTDVLRAYLENDSALEQRRFDSNGEFQAVCESRRN